MTRALCGVRLSTCEHVSERRARGTTPLTLLPSPCRSRLAVSKLAQEVGLKNRRAQSQDTSTSHRVYFSSVALRAVYINKLELANATRDQISALLLRPNV